MYHPRVYEITLDRYLGFNEQEVIFYQYDTESAKLSFTFLENGVPFDIPYTRLVLVIRKPDQKEVYQTIETFSGNTAEIILHNQALTVAGTLKCQIKMYQESKLESTWTFEVKVKPSIGNEDAIESTDEYQVLQQLFLDVDSKKGEMEQAITENINQNNNATQQSIDEMKAATDEAIRSIDESAVGILNQQVLVSNYQTFTAIGSMSRVGENKVATPSHLMETLELGDEDYEQLELLETPATLEEPMEEEIENHPMTLEEPMIVDNDVVPTESGFAKSAILKGHTLVNILNGTKKGSVERQFFDYLIDVPFKVNQVYTAIFTVSSNSSKIHCGLLKGMADGSNIDWNGGNKTCLNGYNKILLTPTDSQSYALRIRSFEEGIEQFDISNVMVIEGDYTNVDIPYFEGMQSVKMPVLTTTGKNLLNINNCLKYKVDNFEIEHSGQGSYTFKNLYSGAWQSTIVDKLKLKANTSYTLSYEYEIIESTGSLVNGVCISLRANGINISGDALSGKSLTFTTDKEYSEVNVHAFTTDSAGGMNKIRFFNVQIEENSVATSFESYKSNILSTPSDLVLRKIGDVQDTLDVNTGEVVQHIGEVVLDGSNDEEWTLFQRNDYDTFTTRQWRYTLPQWGVQSAYPGEEKKSICDKLPFGPLIPDESEDYEHYRTNGSKPSAYVYIWLNQSKASTVSELKAYLQQNPIKIQYQLFTPIIKTVDLNNKPFFFKEGHILLSSEEGTLLPTLEYTVPTNLKGQADNNAESILSLEREKLDIKLVDMKATPNSVVKRDQDGNIRTANKLQMKQADQEIPIELIANSHLKVGNRNVWDDGNLVIETGTFTPSLGCTQGGFPTMNAQSTGAYYRIGEMVYVYGRVLADKANVGESNESKGELYLRGLPFQVHNASGHLHQLLNIANVQNINFGSHQQLTLHLTNGDATAKLRWIDNQTTGWPVVQMSDFGTNNFGFAFSGFYRIR